MDASLLLVAGGIVCAQLFGRVVADPDLWGHVRFGQLILAEGIPALDPYAYTSGTHPWINHELLAEIASGWAYTHFGSVGLQLLRYGLVAAVVALVWRELARGPLGVGGGALAAALVTSAMGLGLATVRPHLFTYLFFALVLVLLVRAERGDYRRIWVVPLLVAVWVNAHGGVLAGVGIVGLWWLGEQTSNVLGTDGNRGVPFLPATLVVAVTVTALLLNPYGWRLPTFLLETATVPRPSITEWHSVATSLPQLFIWGLLVALGLGVLFWRRPSIRPSHRLMLGVLAVLPLLALRHLPLFAIGWAVILSPHMPEIGGARSADRNGRRSHAAREILVPAAFLMLGLAVAGGGVAVAAERGSFPCIPLPAERHAGEALPQGAVELLDRSGVRANLATPFGWGEFVIWHLAPGVRVGMDGRRETVYPDSVYQDYRSFRVGVGDWRRWLDAYGAEAALVRAESPPDNLLALDPGWRELYRSDVSALYGRKSWSEISSLASTPPPDGEFRPVRCFPGAR